MKKFKGTRGPWVQLAEEVDKPYIRIRGTQLGLRYKVANVLTPIYEGVISRDADETRANANLIAAAPELLEALQQSLPIWEAMKLNVSEASVLLDCRAAINKALGVKND